MCSAGLCECEEGGGAGNFPLQQQQGLSAPIEVTAPLRSALLCGGAGQRRLSVTASPWREEENLFFPATQSLYIVCQCWVWTTRVCAQ